MDKSTISMAIFNSYVTLPDGMWTCLPKKLNPSNQKNQSQNPRNHVRHQKEEEERRFWPRGPKKTVVRSSPLRLGCIPQTSLAVISRARRKRFAD